jgi:hypothetical protein
MDFSEIEPNFPPTFKVLRNTVNLEYQPHRVPSYCDRILWKSQPGRKLDLECEEFTSVPEILTSDHKPVRASFVIELPGESI